MIVHKTNVKIVFGIGNPGKKYEKTRHNVGFRVIDRLKSQKSKVKSQKSVVLIKPRTFVNNSGISAKRVLLKYNVNPEDFLVVVDDFNLPLGEIRLRKNGSSGGHKGLDSIIEKIGTKAFPRLRIGIGPLIGDAVEFVLSPFEEEIPIIEKSIDKACLMIKSFITEGIDKAVKFKGVNP